MNKKAIVAIIIFVVLGIGGYLFFSRQDTVIKNYPPKDGPIVAFGDSLVAGTGSSDGKDFVSLLSNGIHEQIINMGVPGDTTLSALARAGDVLKVGPRITIVLLGGNDFLQKVSHTETFANLETIVTKLQESGSIVILLGVRGGLLSDNVASEFKDLAKRTGSAYISDVLGGVFGDSRYMSDSVHPNDAGYLKIAERIFPVVRKLLH